jgi:hypothetical protein
MKENFEEKNNGKYSLEDVGFFDTLVKKYGLEQNEDQLIIIKKDGSKVFLPKWYEVPTKNGKVDIEELIRQNI